MPELKNVFTSGRMNKDFDERIVPKGEYRDAMNIDVVTSESGDVGSVQNIKGNTIINNQNQSGLTNGTSDKYGASQQCVGSIKNEETNAIYYFLTSDNYDAIIECLVNDNGVETIKPVFVSKKEELQDTTNGATTNSTTVELDTAIDDENIWIGQEVTSAGVIQNEGGEVCTITNINHTTKVITLSSAQTIPDGTTLTFGLNVLQFDPENLITGINYIDGLLLWTDNKSEPKRINVKECVCGTTDWKKHTELHVDGKHVLHGTDSKPVKMLEEHITVIKKYPLCAPVLKMSTNKDSNRDSTLTSQATFTSASGDFVDSTPEQRDVGSTLTMQFTLANYKEGDKIRLVSKASTSNTQGPQGEFSFDIRVKLGKEIGRDGSSIWFEATILSMHPDWSTEVATFDCTLEQGDPFFELVFPRFAYRWKYEDGEYSAFSPFTEIAFLPDKAEPIGTLKSGEIYHAKNGYNLAMENELRSLLLQKFDTRPKDVVEVDILFKRSNSTNVYTVKTLKEQQELDDVELDPTISGNETKGFEVSSEQIHTVIEPNQLLRHWDNVPRKALAQEITKNRLIYGNYLQNFNIPEQPHFSVAIKSTPMSGKINLPEASLKSIRTYQVGIVFLDKYGRQSPVFTHDTGVAQLSQRNSSTKNELQISVTNPDGNTLQLPDWATHYKYFIKEYSNEYYNLALDRYYPADDGNIWLSFPSCERNKLTIDTYLVLKKGHGTDAAIVNLENPDLTVKYKILDISDTPPVAVSRTKKSVGTIKTIFGISSSDRGGFPESGQVSFKVPGTEMGSASSPFHSIHEDQLNTKYIRIFNAQSGTKIYQVKEIIAVNKVSDDNDQYPHSDEGDYYQFLLKDVLGPEVSDITMKQGVESLSLTLEILEETDDSGKPEFDGRFFVKVNNDVTMTAGVIQASAEQKTRVIACVDLIHLGYQHIDVMRGSGSGNAEGYVSRKLFKGIGPRDDSDLNADIETHYKTFCLDSAMSYVETDPGDNYKSWRFLPPLDIQEDPDADPIPLHNEQDPVNHDIGSWSNATTGFGNGERKESGNNAALAQGKHRYLACNGGKALNLRFIGYGTPYNSSTWLDKDKGSRSKTDLSLQDFDNDHDFANFDAALRRPGTFLKFNDDPDQRLHKIKKTIPYAVYNYLDGGSTQNRPNLKEKEIEWNSNHGTRYHIEFEEDMVFNPIDPDGTKAYFKGDTDGDGVDEWDTTSNTSPGGNGTPVARLIGKHNAKSGNANSDEKKAKVKDVLTKEENIDKWFTRVCAHERYSEDGEVLSTTNPAIFETEPFEAVDLEIYHETQCTYPISDLAKTRSVTVNDVTTELPDNEKTLKWYNCFTFGNGIESNRIRDSFNLPFIDDGPKVSTVLAEQYKEEVRGNGMIYSGIINTKSGVNRLNQFIMAEKITKDVNPDYGTIQKLHTRNSDIVVLCEDKVLKVLAHKDALYNADGNMNLTATANVLGQTIPFAGEFGISKNPESFAAYSFRSYFTDKSRGAILRLSKDGLTNISEKGMRDYFMDQLATYKVLVGSYDDRKDHYNITMKDTSVTTSGFTVSFSEKADGWTSFKSYIPQSGLSMNNRYYTWYKGNMWKHDTNAVYGNFYGTQAGHYSHITLLINDNPSTIKNFKTLNFEGTVPQSFVYTGTIGSTTITRKTIDELTASGYTSTQIDGLSQIINPGWKCTYVNTAEETGVVDTFINKEGKWFNNLQSSTKGHTTSELLTGDRAKEFIIQGVGNLSVSPTIVGGGAAFTGGNITIDITNGSSNHNTDISDTNEAIQVSGSFSDTKTLTISPNDGYVIKAADFAVASETSSPVADTFVNADVTFTDTSTAYATDNTVTMSVPLNFTMPTQDQTITIGITGVAKKPQHSITGVYSSKITNATEDGTASTLTPVQYTATGEEDGVATLFTKTFTAKTVVGQPLSTLSAIDYTFNTAVDDDDEGNGIVKFNNANAASVTKIFIDDVDAAGLNHEVDYNEIKNQTAAVKGYIKIADNGSTTTSTLYRITSVTDDSGYWEFVVDTPVAGSSAHVTIGAATKDVTLYHADNYNFNNKRPTIDLSGVSSIYNYIVTETDTGSGTTASPYTARQFTVKYKYPNKTVGSAISVLKQTEKIKFNATAQLTPKVASTNRIYNYVMKTSDVVKEGEPRLLTIRGDVGAQLLIDFKNAANSSLISGPVLATLTNGKYEKRLKFPNNTGSSTTYTVTMTEAQSGVSGATASSMFDVSNSLQGATGTPKVKTLTFNQRADVVVTYQATTSNGSLSVSPATITSTRPAGWTDSNIDEEVDLSFTVTSSAGNITANSATTQFDFDETKWTYTSGSTSDGTHTLQNGTIINFSGLKAVPNGTSCVVSGRSNITKYGTANDTTVMDLDAFLALVATAPTATAQSVETAHNTALTITMAGTDPQGGTNLTFAIVNNPTKGTLGSITEGSGLTSTVVYTPFNGSFGSDEFTFTVTDGTTVSSPATVSITVQQVTATKYHVMTGGGSTASAVCGSAWYSPAIDTVYAASPIPVNGMQFFTDAALQTQYTEFTGSSVIHPNNWARFGLAPATGYIGGNCHYAAKIGTLGHVNFVQDCCPT